jgi:hypothetical protein
MSVSKFSSLLLSTFTKFPTVPNLLASTFVFAFVFAVAIAAYATPTVTVISPKSGISAGAPVFYEAYATSPDCAGGIAAMRIYSAPGVNAFTVNGAHIERFIDLAPGTYSTVVQAWDNCGGVSKTPVDLTVGSDAGVSVYLPNQSPANWPVHVAASAESPSCPDGIASIRIYTAPGVAPYTIDSNQLDAYVNLVPGTYDMTIQSWDNCGNVFKSPLTEVVTAGSDAYLYGGAGYYPVSGIAKLDINPDGTLSNASGVTPLPLTKVQANIGNVAVDPGGWFVYAASASGIYAFQIDQSNGNLVAIPGSPFPLNEALGDGQQPPTITMDPTGNFIYLSYYTNTAGVLATYRIQRSSGALTWTGWAQNFSSSDPCPGMTGLTTNFTGQYIYISGETYAGGYDNCNGLIYGLLADPNHGFLNGAAPGSPYSMPSEVPFFSQPVSTSEYLYFLQSSGGVDDLPAYSISSTGALSPLAESPFTFPGLFTGSAPSFFADWEARFLWSFGYFTNDTPIVQAFGVNGGSGDVTLGSVTQPFQNPGGIDLAEDHSGQFVFITLDPYMNQPPPDVPAVGAWAISADGALTELNSVTVSSTYGDAVYSLAVARKDPN